MQQTIQDQASSIVVADIFSGGGAMAKYLRDYDWSGTSLGPIEQWPQSLKTAVSIILNSHHPMFIAWGAEQTFIYNDAYIDVLSLSKHPAALGRPFSEVWAEIWDVCGPLTDKVFQDAKASFVDNVRLFMRRIGYLEETYFSFSYSPIRDEYGNVIGLFSASIETTTKLLNERRLKTLGDLSAKALLEKSIEAAYTAVAKTLAENADDIPFALFYSIDAQAKQAILIETVGVVRGLNGVSPNTIALSEEAATLALWPVVDIWHSAQAKVVSVKSMQGLPLGLAGQPVMDAIVLPLTLMGQDKPIGVLIAGVNPCRLLDEKYRTFYDLVVNQTTTAVQNAKAYEEEKKRIEALAEIDRAKTQFFNNISHEFRTPITLILSPLEDLLTDERYSYTIEQKEQLTLIMHNAQRLLKLVNSLLDFSRIEAKRVQAVYEPTQLAELTVDLASLFRSTVEKAGLSLNIDTSVLAEAVYVDREMYEKIIFNLLSNAFKFTLQGGINVSLSQVDNTVELRVQDTGVGILEAELSQVFERFHRIEATAGRSYEGSGIGLALVQELVKLHGGTIQASSQFGVGTTFTITLPMGRAHLPSEQLGTRAAHQPGNIGLSFIKEAVRWLPEPQSAMLSAVPAQTDTLLESPVQSPRLVPMPKARILLADDNADMRQFVKNLLSPYWEVEAVENGELALQSALALPPDLILSDVMMPKLDGFGLLQALRRHARTATIPIILLSARAGEEAKIEGLQAGADDYLVKPFATKELIARIDAQLKMAQLRKEAAKREQELLLATRTATENLENILSNLKDGFVIFDRDWRYIFVNDSQLELMNKSREEVLGKIYWEVYPDVVDTSLAIALRAVMTTGQSKVVNFFYPTHDRWYEVRIHPSANGISLFNTDISLRKQLETERFQAIEAAKEKERLRAQEAEDYRKRLEEFMDTVCHEIRNPLHGIYGCVDGLNNALLQLETVLQTQDKTLSWEIGGAIRKQLDELNDVQTSLRMCMEQQTLIVDDVLDLSKLENNKLSLDLAAFNPKQALLKAVQMFNPKLSQKGLTIHLELSEDFYIEGDAKRFTQVLNNLLSNAIKFTPQGSITLSLTYKMLSEDKLQVVLHVKDTGIGMTKDETNRLFQPFSQSTSKIASQYGGTGLGLAISKRLVAMMGGSIEVSSEKNRGTDFWLTIYATPASQPKLSEQQVYSPTSEHFLAARRILVVEDNVINRKVLVNHMRQAGHNYEVAKHGLEALQLYQEAVKKRENFDVIFMDIEMPVMDGLEATRQIRQYEQQAKLLPVKIIGASGNARKEQIKRALDAGMNAYITKPYHKEQLYDEINQTKVLANSTGISLQGMFAKSARSVDVTDYVQHFQQIAQKLLEQHHPFSTYYQDKQITIELLPKLPELPSLYCELLLEKLKENLSTVFAPLGFSHLKLNPTQLRFEMTSQQHASMVQSVLTEVGLDQTVAIAQPFSPQHRLEV
jgi:signal transduction histidine kinase